MKANAKKIAKKIKSNFQESKEYLFSSSKYIYSIIIIFFLFGLIGFFVKVPEEITLQILNYFEQILSQTEHLSPSGMILFLLQNNIFASLLGVILGSFFGIFTLITGALNGFILGFASNISVVENGIISLWKILPHGIFELPALFISLGLGMRMGSEFISKYFKTKKMPKQILIMIVLTILALLLLSLISILAQKAISFIAITIIAIGIYFFLKDKKLKKHFTLSISVFLYIVIPLLIIAAIIEGILISLA